METATFYLPFINLGILITGAFIAIKQLTKTAANSRVSALARVMSEQRAISELMLKYDDLRSTLYPKSGAHDARQAIFLTLLINNASLAYEQIKLGVVQGKQSKVLMEHLRKEFRQSPELTERLKATKDAYDPYFISLVLDP
ncbi:MAG: hypothetical protein JRI96_04375 [Deltaproteobacteria bacterium]|nr:hypothetical protein [Deltaproteobacteria bacterium]